jgi:hypothetical protein
MTDAANNEADSKPSRSILRRMRRCAAWMLYYAVTSLLILSAIEVALRIAGVGTDTHYLQRHTFDGVTYYSPNRAFFDQFSTLPMEKITNWDCMEWLARPEKAPDTFRVVLFGESAVYGTPYPEYGFPRYLTAMLEGAFPNKKIEIINAACPGINTFTMQVVAHELCAALRPDVCVIYAGNNEGCMPYAPSTFIGGNALLSRPFFVRVHVALRGLRIVQLGLAMMQRAGALKDAPLEYSSGEPGEITLAAYRANIEDMVRSACDSGAKTVLCTLGRNRHLKDTPVDIFNGAPSNRAEPMPLPFNAIVKDVTEKNHSRNTFLANIENSLNCECPSGYLPAYNFFTDLVHLNFEGDYEVAKDLFYYVAENACLKFGIRKTDLVTSILTKEDCEARLGLSSEAKVRLTETLTKGMDFSDCDAARQWMAQYRNPAAPGEAETLRAALAAHPGDPILYSALYAALSLAGDYQGALGVARDYQKQFPIRRGAHSMQAEALFLKDMREEARKEALAELERYPDDIRAHRVLARIAARDAAK